MAFANDIDREEQGSSPVQITDKDENNKADVTPQEQLSSVEYYNEDLVQGEIDITGNGVTALAAAGVSNLVGRKRLRIFNFGNTITWYRQGYTGTLKERINRNSSVELPFGDNINIILEERGGGNQIRAVIYEYK